MKIAPILVAVALSVALIGGLMVYSDAMKTARSAPEMMARDQQATDKALQAAAVYKEKYGLK